MKIEKLENVKFGIPGVYKKVSGYAVYEEGKGYYAYSNQRDIFGILTPYIIPYIYDGGIKTFEFLLKNGDFTSMNGMEFVNPIKEKEEQINDKDNRQIFR